MLLFMCLECSSGAKSDLLLQTLLVLTRESLFVMVHIYVILELICFPKTSLTPREGAFVELVPSLSGRRRRWTGALVRC